jgi:formylglycine-generating enzyme required for sulfatase activity
MQAAPVIDTAWHPLADGCPPDWASGWGQDPYGVFVELTLGEVTQCLHWIPPGRFLMGSPDEETRGLAKEGYVHEWLEREHPRHRVFITKGFWLFDTACTQALWEAVMSHNPSRFRSPDRPVERVSWTGANDFIDRINARIPGLELVLPTEAQWEHACRGGTETAIYTGDLEIRGLRNAPALEHIAWYGGNSGVDFDLEEGEDSTSWPEKQYPHTRAGTRKVKSKQPNPWGLYDMLGNVWEWCCDGLREYGTEPAIDPLGPEGSGVARIIRGGSWYSYAGICRSAYRLQNAPGIRSDYLGFRCARAQGS